MKNYGLTPLGAGAGLRHAHFDDIIKNKPAFRWFEVISEDFMNFGGYVKEAFEEIRKHYKVVGHGVCMSIGSSDPLDMTYLKNLKTFLDHINSPWTSDHLCFTMVDHTNLNDLIPLPFTREAVDNVVARVKIVQDVLERPFLLENVTRYVTVSDREMNESQFINSILEESGCGLLLDITNAFLNAHFHGNDAFEFIKSLPLDRVGQMHVAGWESLEDGSFIDSHDAPVPQPVWDLFQQVLELTGPSSVIVEWDKLLPPVGRLLDEANQANAIIDSYIAARAA